VLALVAVCRFASLIDAGSCSGDFDDVSLAIVSSRSIDDFD